MGECVPRAQFPGILGKYERVSFHGTACGELLARTEPKNRPHGMRAHEWRGVRSGQGDELREKRRVADVSGHDACVTKQADEFQPLESRPVRVLFPCSDAE